MISRLSRVLVAMLASLALGIAGLGCGSDDDSGDSREARALLQRAFDKKVESGDLEVQVKTDLDGLDSMKEPLELRLAGPFKSAGADRLPMLDWDVTFDGAGQKLSGGLIATGDNAYVVLQGRAFEVGEEAYRSLAARLQAGGRKRPLTPGQFGMDTGSWLEDARVEDGESIGGDDTRKVTGSVDVRKVIEDVVELIDSPELRRRLEGSGRPAVPKPTDKDLRQIEDAIEDMDVEMNVDENGVLRRFFTEVELDVESEGEDVTGKVSFLYLLREVGGDPVIRAPADARPLGELLGGLGLGALGELTR